MHLNKTYLFIQKKKKIVGGRGDLNPLQVSS